MKKRYLKFFLVSTIASLLVTNLFGQTHKMDFEQLKKHHATQQSSIMAGELIMGADLKYLPTIAKHYYFNSSSNLYEYSYDELIKYNSNGDVVSQVSYSTGTRDSSSKTLYKYNAVGEETEYLRYNWILSAWVLQNGYATTYKVDLVGRATEEVNSSYDSESKLWKNSYKAVYAYVNATDKGFKTLTNFDWKNNAWVGEARYIDVVWKNVEGREIIGYTEQKYFAGQWINIEKVAHSYDGKNYVAIIDTAISSNSWTASGKETVTFDALGNRTRITQRYLKGVLVNHKKDLRFVDSKGNDAGYQDYSWVNGAWKLDYSSISTNTYNLNGALEESIKEYSSGGMPTKSKTVYSNFISVATGTAEPSLADLLSIYPIPAKEMITISPLSNEPLTFKVYNAQGTQIPTIINNNTMNVTDWNAGIYYLNIRTAAGKNFTKKLIKE